MSSPAPSVITLSVPSLVAVVVGSALLAGTATWTLRPPPAVPEPPPAVPTAVTCACKCEPPEVVLAPPRPFPDTPPPAPPRPQLSGTGPCLGMTWSLLKQEKNVVRVGSDPAHTNAYQGDTACDVSLSVLCLNPKNLPKPEGLASDFYSGWSGAEVAASKPMAGTLLTSREAADAVCAKSFGQGWRMAEHHDGHGGWGLTGLGEVPRDARFWVAINDQPANPWTPRSRPRE